MFSKTTKTRIRNFMEPRGYMAMWIGSSIAFIFVMAIALMVMSTTPATDGSAATQSTEAPVGQSVPAPPVN